jgi:hypothetical protein
MHQIAGPPAGRVRFPPTKGERMGRRAKWFAGAAVAVLPVLAVASPAAADLIIDEDGEQDVTFSLQGGGTATCTGIGVQHLLDTDRAQAAAALSIGGPSACRGRIEVDIRYTDDHGDPARSVSVSAGATYGSVFVFDVGGRVSVVDYRLTFDNCQSNCVHSFRTTTK